MTGPDENTRQTDETSRATSRFGTAFLACKSWKWSPWVMLVLICLLAVALRCLHLLKADHYYILSPDSYFFHRMADLVASVRTTTTQPLEGCCRTGSIAA